MKYLLTRVATKLLWYVAILFLSVTVFSRNAWAASYTWNVVSGGDGTTWTDPNNWGGLGYPQDGDDATIALTSGTVTLTGSIVCTSLTIGNGTNTFTVSLGSNVAVSGNLIVARYGTLAVGARTITVGGSINNTQGSITVSTGTITTSGSISNAVITCTGSATINLGGNWAINSFTPSTSTVNFTGTSQVITSGSSGFFYNVNGNDVTAQTSVSVQGNWGIANFSAGTNTVTFNGASSSTISTSTTFNNLTINKSSNAGVSTGSNISVNGVLNLQSGVMTVTGSLTVNIGGSTFGGGASSYVDGPLTIDGNGTKQYLIGDGGLFRPIILSGTSNTATTFQFFASNPGGTAQDPLKGISINRYWRGEGGILTSTDVALGYDPNSDGIGNAGNIVVASSTDQNGDYYSRGGIIIGSPFNDWGINGISSDPTFSLAGTNPEYFTLGTTTDDNPLPVELTKFTAFPDGKGVLLNWTTATETDNLGFIVSRSESKSGPFQQIASYQSNVNLKGKGTTATESNYKLGDYSTVLRSGKTYFYRLEDVNLKGDRNVLGTKEVRLPNEYNLSQNYPNPFNPSTTIQFNLKQDGKALLEVYNLLGQKVATLVNGDLKSGAYTYNWNAAGQATGVYFYRLVSGSFVQTKKMVLTK